MRVKAISVLWAISRKLARDERGVSMVIIAIGLAVLIGLTGLAVEAGLWYTIKRANQSAADMAALSGALELAANKTYPDICALAQYTAARNGFTFAQGWSCPAQSPAQQSACTNLASGQMCVNNPPLFGVSAGNNAAVEVILSQQQNTFFARQNPDLTNLGSVLLPNVTINTRAVAATSMNGNGVACSMGLDGPPGAGNDPKNVYLRGNPTVTLNCALVSDSTSKDAVDVQGNSSLTASELYTAGNCTGSCPPNTVDFGAPIPDPYAGQIKYTLPTNATVCVNAPASGIINPPAAGQFYCPMSITGNATLNPGIYYIDDTSGGNAFSVTNGTVTGSGVTIISSAPSGTTKAGLFNISANAIVTLSAPTTSTPAGCTANSPACIPSGILFYQDPSVADTSCVKNNISTSSCNTLTANSNGALTGVIYTPKTVVQFQGNDNNSGCLVVIALAIVYSGTSTINASQAACSAAGVNTPPEIIQSALLE
jgi:Flp pilus assembly protein TadG